MKFVATLLLRCFDSSVKCPDLVTKLHNWSSSMLCLATQIEQDLFALLDLETTVPK
jgi:hypothetical protein